MAEGVSQVRNDTAASQTGRTEHRQGDDAAPPPSIQARNLNYKFPDGTIGLKDVDLSFPAGSRTLLIGANGAGKTTLLRLLSGKRLAPAGTITINGLDPFKDNLTGITYLGLEWVLNPIVRSDIAVPTLLASVGGDVYAARRDELVRILDVDLGWRLHAVSDGERRRVQLVMGLLRPWHILLLDEVTVDLDLLSRRRFLDWLKRETEREVLIGDLEGEEQRRGKCTVVYATHIMDGLSEWPTHLVHMSMGQVKEWGRLNKWKGSSSTPPPTKDSAMNTAITNSDTSTPDKEGKQPEAVTNEGKAMETKSQKPALVDGKLGDLVMHWLIDDLEERGPRNQQTSATGTGVGMGSEAKSYAAMQGVGGYGSETRKN